MILSSDFNRYAILPQVIEVRKNAILWCSYNDEANLSPSCVHLLARTIAES